MLYICIIIYYVLINICTYSKTSNWLLNVAPLLSGAEWQMNNVIGKIDRFSRIGSPNIKERYVFI